MEVEPTAAAEALPAHTCFPSLALGGARDLRGKPQVQRSTLVHRPTVAEDLLSVDKWCEKDALSLSMSQIGDMLQEKHKQPKFATQFGFDNLKILVK